MKNAIVNTFSLFRTIKNSSFEITSKRYNYRLVAQTKLRQDLRMTNYDTEFHLLCACHTLESTKYKRKKATRNDSLPPFAWNDWRLADMCILLSLLLFFFTAMYCFVAGLFVGYTYFTVDLMCLVVNRMFVKTVLFCVSHYYLYSLHDVYMQCNCMRPFVHFAHSFVCSFVRSLYGVGVAVTVCHNQIETSAHKIYRYSRGKLHAHVYSTVVIIIIIMIIIIAIYI